MPAGADIRRRIIHEVLAVAERYDSDVVTAVRPIAARDLVHQQDAALSALDRLAPCFHGCVVRDSVLIECDRLPLCAKCRETGRNALVSRSLIGIGISVVREPFRRFCGIYIQKVSASSRAAPGNGDGLRSIRIPRIIILFIVMHPLPPLLFSDAPR